MEGGPQLNTPTFRTCDSYQCKALVLNKQSHALQISKWTHVHSMMAAKFQVTGTLSLSISDWMMACLVDGRCGIST